MSFLTHEVHATEDLPLAAAKQVAHALRTVTQDGPVSFAVSGGSTSVALFKALRTLDVNWDYVSLYFVDERCVPPDHADSNYRLAREHLLEPLNFPAERVHRMEGELPTRDEAARRYASNLPAELGVVVLGLGEDGHVASLFPGHVLLKEQTLRVATLADSPKPPPERLTLTLASLRTARVLIGVASGAGKQDAVRKLLAGEDIPAAKVDRVHWLFDRAAAGETR